MTDSIAWSDGISIKLKIVWQDELTKEVKTTATYYGEVIVDMNGPILLFDLLPAQEVKIIVLDRTGLSKKIQHWLSNFRDRHPFAK